MTQKDKKGKTTKKELIGLRYGKLIVVSQLRSHIYPSGNPRRKWLCLCDCGNYTEVLSNYLLNGDTKSCGCLVAETSKTNGENNFIDITGKKYGRLTVLSLNSVKKNGTFWNCKCSCGELMVTRGQSLKSGETKSCGCLQLESLSKRESKIATLLKEYCKEKYSAEVEYKECINPETKRYMPYDIYISFYKLYIEVMGVQHYKDTWFGKRDDYIKRKKKDKLKKKHAIKNGFYLEIDLREIKTIDEAIEITEKVILSVSKGVINK